MMKFVELLWMGFVKSIPATAINASIEDILKSLNLINDEHLTNAAMVLFGKNLFPHYAQCMLTMGRFKGINHLGDLIDNQQAYGNIFTLLAEADIFLRRHLPVASFFHLTSLNESINLLSLHLHFVKRW